jgi:hypothetical protein
MRAKEKSALFAYGNPRRVPNLKIVFKSNVIDIGRDHHVRLRTEIGRISKTQRTVRRERKVQLDSATCEATVADEPAGRELWSVTGLSEVHNGISVR